MTPLTIFVGASATGKTTLCEMFAKATHSKSIVSTTTRPRRPADKDGSYIFIQRDNFDKNDFVEYVVYDKHLYGSSKQEVDSSGFGVIEIEGTKLIKQYCEKQGRKCIVVGIIAPKDARLNRMLLRGDDIEKAMERVRVDNDEFSTDRMLSVCDHLFVGGTIEELYHDIGEVVLKEYE